MIGGLLTPSELTEPMTLTSLVASLTVSAWLTGLWATGKKSIWALTLPLASRVPVVSR